MSHAYWREVFSPKQHPVKNLGWLLAHAKEVKEIQIENLGNGRAQLVALLSYKETRDRLYFCTFESIVVARDWLKKRTQHCLSHVKVLEEKNAT